MTSDERRAIGIRWAQVFYIITWNFVIGRFAPFNGIPHSTCGRSGHETSHDARRSFLTLDIYEFRYIQYQECYLIKTTYAWLSTGVGYGQ